MRSRQFLQLAKAAKAVKMFEPAAGPRRVVVLERGDRWVMYVVVTDISIRLGYAEWREGHYKVFAMLTSKCAFYNGDGIVVGHKLTVRDIADLFAVRSAKDLIKLVWNRVNEALNDGEGEPCEGVWVLI